MINRLPLIEKVHLLESKLGDSWTHPILEPFKFDCYDILKVQEAGKKIAQHLGLPPLTFIITYAHQKSKVGGHINLDSSKDVFIEIDDKFKQDNEIVLAILAHEICHKYLAINNLRDFRELENEILTDAATIFTGLGKLSLNGCEKSDILIGLSPNTKTTTTTQKVGYMNRNQFAFVYRLVCEMRRIPEDSMLQGLTPEAINEVKNVSNNDSICFNAIFFNNDLTLHNISEVIKNEVGDSQKKFARLNKNMRVIQDRVLTSADQMYNDFHSYTKTKTEAIISAASKSCNKESHNYIKNLVALEELELFKSKIIEKDKEIEKLGTAFLKFVNFIGTSFPKLYSPLNSEFLFQFECPSCKNKMRVSERKLVRVKCPKCNYSFVIDTGAEETIIAESKTIVQEKKYKNVLWIKIKSLFNNHL